MTIFTTIYDKNHKRVPYLFAKANQYMSGRWHRRDGDTYGIVAPQPPITAEPPIADDPPGHLRPSAERRD